MKWFRIAFFFIGLISYTSSNAQPFNVPLNQAFSVELERKLVRSNSTATSSFKPFILNKVRSDEKDSISTFSTFSISYKKQRSFVARKLFYEHIISLDTGIIHLSIDPLVNLELGEEPDDKRDVNLFKNTRGFNMKLAIGEKVAIESSFRENQANLPQYLDRRVRSSRMAFGQGRIKRFNDLGFDFAMSSAYMSYSLNANINIQAGHGKHFIGSGHRSVLLSDLSFNYPFLRLNTNWLNQRLHYHNLYALLQNMNRLPSGSLAENLFERKQAAFHYLEYKISDKISLGLFEGVIFPTLDSSGNRSNGINYWLPVIGLNSIMEGPEDLGNSLAGLNLEVQLFNHLKLYQQLAFFDEESEDIGFQSGFQWYFKDYFMLQGELNNLNFDIQKNQYNHNEESLTLPYQTDVIETLAIFQFQKKRWLSRLSGHYFELKANEVLFFDFRQSYIVNPSSSLSMNIGVQYRDEEASIQNNETLFFYFGLSTNLQNLYFNY